MLKEGINLTCRQCGREFMFSRAEQEFYELKGFAFPGRCPECRPAKQNQPHRFVCSQCGTELEQETHVYCAACLASISFECEQKAKKKEKKASEEHTKLLITESHKAEVEELLRQKELIIEELKQDINNLSQDLEKAYQLHSTLGWLQPVLNDIKGRLDALEQAQNKTNERMLQVVQKMHELFDNISFLALIKRSLRTVSGKVSGPDETQWGTNQVKPR